MANSFTDLKGRCHSLDFTFAEARKLRALDINMLDIGGMLQLVSDPFEWQNALFTIVNTQRSGVGLPAIERQCFDESTNGQTLEDAAKAMLGAIESFCPSDQKPLIAEIRKAAEAEAAAAMAKLMAELSNGSPKESS